MLMHIRNKGGNSVISLAPAQVDQQVHIQGFNARTRTIFVAGLWYPHVIKHGALFNMQTVC